MEPVSHLEWLDEGRLSSYVTERRVAGQALSAFELQQPEGDMSDPPTTDLVLIQSVSRLIRHESDLGGGKFAGNDRAGTLYLAPPNFATDIQVFDPHRIRVFALPAARYREALLEATPQAASFDFGQLHAGGFLSPRLSAVIGRVWRDAELPGGAGSLAAQSHALMILAELSALAFLPPRPARGGLAPRAERRCRDFIRDNLARDISLDEIAAVADLSVFHFARMFKESVGMPPAAYQRHMRSERAKELLAGTNMPVGAVAATVGYETPQAFARMFRIETGDAPSEWRRVHRA